MAGQEWCAVSNGAARGLALLLPSRLSCVYLCLDSASLTLGGYGTNGVYRVTGIV